MLKLIVATRNAHKVEEIGSILGVACRCVSLKDFPQCPELIEDAPTFAGNATRKAVQVAKWIAETRTGAPTVTSEEDCMVLADDSGLEVDALNGAPGVKSARFAALDSTAPRNSRDSDNNAKLLRLLEGVPASKRTARFRCVLALTPVEGTPREDTSPGGPAPPWEQQTRLFEGVCEGSIAFAPSGRGGFGYDPLFVPFGHAASFAEMAASLKNQISHRARALAALKVAINDLH